jgi:hypothetical protein
VVSWWLLGEVSAGVCGRGGQQRVNTTSSLVVDTMAVQPDGSMAAHLRPAAERESIMGGPL